MFRPPRSYRKNVVVPLYWLRKRTLPAIWVVMFLLCCFILPFGAAIKIVHPGILATIRIGLEMAQQSAVHGTLFVFVLLFLGSFFMFIVNSAFVFMRTTMGYEVRRNGTVLRWLINKATQRRSPPP